MPSVLLVVAFLMFVWICSHFIKFCCCSCVIADFKVNVMSLDDLIPASVGFTEETPEIQVGNDRCELRTV